MVAEVCANKDDPVGSALDATEPDCLTLLAFSLNQYKSNKNEKKEKKTEDLVVIARDILEEVIVKVLFLLDQDKHLYTG